MGRSIISQRKKVDVYNYTRKAGKIAQSINSPVPKRGFSERLELSGKSDANSFSGEVSAKLRIREVQGQVKPPQHQIRGKSANKNRYSNFKTIKKSPGKFCL